VNLVIAAAVFPLIFFGELPDKSMFASVVLATKGNPAAVWLGAAAAFAVHVTIATTAGMAAVLLFPRRVLEGIVAAMFLAGAVLLAHEARRDYKNANGESEAVVSAPPVGRTVMTAFVVIFIGEWGDLTQILTANLAAQYRSPLSVGLGALLGLWSVTALAVTGGRWLRQVANFALIRALMAVLLTVLAAYAGWRALT
jgi:Ca2+/H+ antiporter, TMEM165/GDT1 family